MKAQEDVDDEIFRSLRPYTKRQQYFIKAEKIKPD